MVREFCHGRTYAVCDPLKDRQSMASRCREFGISRKTGYKIWLVSVMDYDFSDIDLEEKSVPKVYRNILFT